MIRRLKKVVKRTTATGLGAIIGGGVGYGVSSFFRYVAEANVRVRPELAKVSWLDAAFAGHFGNWIMYHYGEPITYASAGTLALIGAGILYYLSKSQ